MTVNGKFQSTSRSMICESLGDRHDVPAVSRMPSVTLTAAIATWPESQQQRPA